MTDSFHGQIKLEKLDTVASDNQDVRELWAVRPHAIFVMMMYTLESRRTFRPDLALCDLHEFLCLNVTDIHEGISEIVSGTISTSAFLLDVTRYVFFRGDSFPVGCSCWTTSHSNYEGQLYRYWHYGSRILRCAGRRSRASLGCCGIDRPFVFTEFSSSGVRSLPRTRRRGINRSLRRLLRLNVSSRTNGRRPLAAAGG